MITRVCSRKLEEREPQARHAPRWINDPILARKHSSVQELAYCYKDNMKLDNPMRFLNANKEFSELKTDT